MAAWPTSIPGMHRLMINGLVDTPLVFTMEDIMRFPRENRTYFLECAANTGMEWRGAQLNGCQFTHGMIHNVVYTGVPLRLLLEEAGVRTNAAWILPEGADASAMTRSIPLEKALDDCLVATHMNGERLRPEQGYPIRLVVPGWEGNMWVKWLRRIEVGDQPWHHREETSKYTDLLEDGNARRFTWVMDAKSVITNPSPQAPITHGPGPTVITGVAWSGRGTIPRVDVTLDGGMNWHQARMSGRRSISRCTGSTMSSTGMAHRSCCKAGRMTPPATCSRRRRCCARCGARTPSITTTVSRPGRSTRTVRPRTWRSAEP
jgi:sulfane dehydrogenase subunit SoxC